MTGMEASKTTQNKLLALIVIFIVIGISAHAVSGSRTTRTPDFTRPLYFDVLGGPNMPAPVVEYEMLEQGSRLKLGPTTIDEKSFVFGLRRLSDIDQNWGAAGETYFYVKWPELLFTEVAIELLTRDGNVIWKRKVQKTDLQKWNLKVRKELKSLRSPITQMSWALELSSANLPFEGLADGFKFCISPLVRNAQARLCSQRYVVRSSGSKILLGRLQGTVTPRILINGDIAPEKGEVKAEAGMPVRFFTEFATGETLDFTSKPLNVAWADFAKIEGKELYSVIGYETPPAGKYKIMNPDRHSKWIQSMGFQPTIYDRRKFWLMQVENPWIYFPGESGGIFKHPLPSDRAPSSKIRLYLDKRTPTGTYRDGVKLRGRKQASTSLNSQEYRVRINSAEEFTWSFKASKNARINRSSLLLNDSGQTYRSYFELYKGYSNELSTRLSMIISSSGLILMGDAAYNLWFEDVLGWDNYYLSKQRWGISTKYFQSITKYKVKLGSAKGDAELRVMNADLKYRLTPGIWTRDESHGIMVSYQDFKVDLGVAKFEVPMIGAGWFWARSMPKSIDDIFNVLPFMNYPKWVDMEFIYYMASMDSVKKLSVNFALNFHGQVLWKDNFFGEAGFGIKRYDFIDTNNSFQPRSNLGYQLNTLYGTLGVGVKF